ncbi:MAG: hypothetical protein M4D80_31895 [Myxococcota bacterium]|nr:hypothetical protein [Myxococcota bacterium]
MPKQYAKRKDAHNTKILAKAGKANGAGSGKAPERPAGELGSKRQGVSRSGRSRVNRG